jgi:serine/threonine protein kinase/tetratricopeptide (TPR) repeat protein
MSACDISDSLRIQSGVAACAECGSTARVGRGFCLNCMLQRALGCETETTETLNEVLDEVNVRDADWRIGNYQILEEIGRGGMGVIYRARQRHSRRIVALKRILSYQAESQETLVRFRREAEAAASLDHPNILPIYEVSESDDGLPFFSMKFAPGGSLMDVAPTIRNDPRRIVALMAKVTRAVQYAHVQGILHRDLKPGNILLDGRGEPMVSDFGLAKWLDTSSDLTRTLMIFGTPGYIAPEQGQGPAKNLTPTADIYSIGAVLFDLFTGRTPFLGEHALAVIKQAGEKPAPKLRTLAPMADRDLETICAKCLEREPQARYRSSGDLAEDLERWLEGRTIIARPVSAPVRIWRWSKRNPKLASSVAAAVFLGAVGVIAAFTSSRLSSIVQRAEIARHSVVVTPFEDLDNLSNASPQARKATGAFAAALGNVSGIHVKLAPENVEEDLWRAEDFKQVGNASGARMVLRGSVRQREGKQHVALHLIETATGSVVNTSLQDAVSCSEIAQGSVMKISDILGNTKELPSIVSAGDTNNPEARSYYERGKELFFRYNLADLTRAIDSFHKAIEIDQNYAFAHAMLATALQAQIQLEPTDALVSQAETAATTALRIAPMLPEAHRAYAGNLLIRGRVQASIDSYLTAYELDPSNARAAATVGNTYDFLGRPDLAIPWFEKAMRRETRPVYADNLAEAWMDLDDYQKAEAAYQTAAIFRPDLASAALGMSRLALFRGDYEEARKRCEAARAKFKDNPQPLLMEAMIAFFSRRFVEAEKLYREAVASNRTGAIDFAGSVRFLSAIGFIQRKSGSEAEGKALLEEATTLDEKEAASAPENPRPLYSLAADYAALGNRDAAVSILDKAIEMGWIDHRSITLDPRFDSIRNLSDFKNTLSQLKERVREMRRQQSGRETDHQPQQNKN